MFEKLEIFRMAHALATHAGARQSVVAQNMANADTPDYRARDVTPFKEIIESGDSGFVPRVTRPGHLHAAALPFDLGIAEVRDVETDPNGNSVSLETEMMKAVDVKREHDRALAVYKSSLGVLRSALGRR
ncbi:FlgB family protein [Roseovarius aestuarii]|uniref:Flagellar basal body rod protein FlgB n=1 Tax=Roseovarius aestuarii TaxID=475083 RepID=A0A1X7BQH2_9RHOB|nr:FlgB family protein [Roseovarius aestuarii]SMC11872.1 flagellar basal body rod protein FlgB [Roseovarius aestuarii]